MILQKLHAELDATIQYRIIDEEKNKILLKPLNLTLEINDLQVEPMILALNIEQLK